jgi:hypothetical protein
MSLFRRLPSHSMRKPLQILALAVALSILGLWMARGAHRGWSMDRVPVKQVDEVTGLDHVTYEDRYVPGVDFVAFGLGAAIVLAGLSLIFRKNNQPTS